MTFSSFPESNDEAVLTEPPLSHPLYGASFNQAVRRFFAKYARFKGYASRSEYWWVVLFLIVISFALSAIGSLTNDTVYAILNVAYLVVFIVPILSLGWRRLHDAGFAGPWYFLNLIPILGYIAVLVMTILPTNPQKHKEIWDDPENL